MGDLAASPLLWGGGVSALVVAGRSLGDLARADARGAGAHALGGAVDNGPHLLHVGIPASLGTTVGVAQVHAERRLLAAHLTYSCHVAPHFLVTSP